MSQPETRRATLLQFYQEYLQSEKSADFVRRVTTTYLPASLEQLALRGDAPTRRAAALALGMVGDYRQNASLGIALHDSDRGVRILAENGIRQLWKRDGSAAQRHQLEELIRLNLCGMFDEAIQLATRMVDATSSFAEAWNQRAIAFYQLDRFAESIADCHETLERNPYHFGAAAGMGQCYLESGDEHSALECFGRALRLNPCLESVRAQVRYLRRSLEDR